MILFTIFFLAFMEVSLSFDNAIINAGVLKEMNLVWQKRFITWGMLIAVFGMRLLFPIVVVWVVSGIGLVDSLKLAIYSPERYAAALSGGHAYIDVFGGMFLFMVFLNFLFEDKDVYWLGSIEKFFSTYFKMESIEVVLSLTLLGMLQHFHPEFPSLFLYGTEGIILYVLINGFMGDNKVAKTGIAAFIYLEVLDASCSFDGVVGAFVLTNNIFYIMIGLGTGALCIRSLTLYLVRGGKLDEFIYLEHGAHYAIGALSMIMLLDIIMDIPESITGMIGISLIGLSMWSSIKYRNDRNR